MNPTLFFKNNDILGNDNLKQAMQEYVQKTLPVLHQRVKIRKTKTKDEERIIMSFKKCSSDIGTIVFKKLAAVPENFIVEVRSNKVDVDSIDDYLMNYVAGRISASNDTPVELYRSAFADLDRIRRIQYEMECSVENMQDALRPFIETFTYVGRKA